MQIYQQVSYKGILFQGCSPLPTHSLSYYPFTNPLTAKERFIKQFYWLHSIEFTSSNCLCCSLYPLVLYIYMIYFKAIGSIYYKIYYKIERAREEGHVTSRRPSLKKWKMAKVSFTAKISSYLSIKVKR